jgi:predicted RNA-binding Zn ribbon-like protein
MPQCAGTKRNNERCTATVEPPQTHCWWHDPANAEQRRRAASKGGKSKPNRDVANVKRRLSEMADGVLDGSVDKGVGAVASQILNVYLRAVGIELKLKEQLELEARIEELSEAFERQKGGSAYGSTG